MKNRFFACWFFLFLISPLPLVHEELRPEAPTNATNVDSVLNTEALEYSTQRGEGSLEYHVSHVPWQVWVRTTAGFEGDASGLYGVELGRVLQPMARPSPFSKAANSHDEAGPRIESGAPSCGLGTLRWRLRVLLPFGSPLGEGNRTAGFFSQRLAIRLQLKGLATETAG
jgi:hypothetical protein